MVRILLIDDDADLRHYLRRELEAEGRAIHCLERAEQGPDLLAASTFDLVLLDNKMPGMSGLEFLDALRRRGLETPVILMTGYATTDTAMEAMNLGAFDYVIKPDDFAGLLVELRPLIAAALEIAQPVAEVRLPVESPADTESGPMMVGKSRPMMETAKLIGCIARSDDAVLILGETGTGKELVARAIHTRGPRKGRPFVALNCTAFNENLLDDELFGHEIGAFTGADKMRKGRFEYANGGTLFLDEMGDMPLTLQAKLLRVLENKEVFRIGSNEPIKVNVRVLSATHRDLESAIQEGTFRRDLFHRLNRVTIRVPALRERLEDLPELAGYFLARAAREDGRTTPSLAATALERLRGYPWPGNVRELQNVLFRAVRVCRGSQILPNHLDFPAACNGPLPAHPQAEGEEVLAGLRQAIARAWDSGQPQLWPFLRDLLERELLALALVRLEGNQTKVAERLDLARNTVIKRMQEYGLK